METKQILKFDKIFWDLTFLCHWIKKTFEWDTNYY